MAPIAETVTTSNMGQGFVLLSFTSGTTGRVIDFEVDLADTWLPVMGGNPEHPINFIQTGKGSGKIKVTLDEVADFDATTVRGKQASIVLQQAKPLASSKKWSLSAGNAVVNVISFKGDRNKNVSTCVLEITPYTTVGGTLWAFDADASDA